MTVDYAKLFDREILIEILTQYRKRIQKEIDSVKDLTALLMKGTRGKWTKNEILMIKAHFVTLGKKVPILMVFMLPGGIILLPLLIEVLDRRKKKVSVSKDRRKSPK